jgi:hypothetical protein
LARQEDGKAKGLEVQNSQMVGCHSFVVVAVVGKGDGHQNGRTSTNRKGKERKRKRKEKLVSKHTRFVASKVNWGTWTREEEEEEAFTWEPRRIITMQEAIGKRLCWTYWVDGQSNGGTSMRNL